MTAFFFLKYTPLLLSGAKCALIGRPDSIRQVSGGLGGGKAWEGVDGEGWRGVLARVGEGYEGVGEGVCKVRGNGGEDFNGKEFQSNQSNTTNQTNQTNQTNGNATNPNATQTNANPTNPDKKSK